MKKDRKHNRNLKGYSLTEMMVTLFILSMLTAAGTAVFNSSQESLDSNYHRLILQQELRKILWTMSQEIRESSPSSPTPITTGPNSITFEIPSTVSGNQVTQWTQISYGLAPDTTVTRTSGGQTTVIGNSIQSLNFVYPYNVDTAPRTVQIQITGSRNTLKRNLSVTLTGQVILRNP